MGLYPLHDEKVKDVIAANILLLNDGEPEKVLKMRKKHIKFIELRAAGQSYNKIAKQLKASKSTLIEWSRQYAHEIKNAKALELESIREQYLLNREHRLKVLGTQLNQMTNEILKRNLSEVTTWRLFDMQRKLIAQIAKEDENIEFTQDIERTVSGEIEAFQRKTVKWTG